MSKEWKIYTKAGDKGETSLIGGRRVPKYDLQIEAYGTVDELNSFVGLIREQDDIDEQNRSSLLEIMDRLFTLESLLAVDRQNTEPLTSAARPLPSLQEEDVFFLEKEIDRMSASLPVLKSFILPGGTKSAALCHVARCVCRRAERTCLRLAQEIMVEPLAIKYLNRLSDYFFVLARWCNHSSGGKEIPWRPRL